MRFIDRVRERVQAPELADLASPGSTHHRLLALREVAREDLSLARMVEGHVDATTILVEAGRAPDPDALYGIWASRGSCSLRPREGSERRSLSGTKPFCSGSDLVDRALVLVDDGEQLVDLDMSERRSWAVVEDTPWCTPAFAETHTQTLRFSGHTVEPLAMINAAGWYFRRRGFWVGALSPAACWAGGAIGLIDHARHSAGRDPHARASVGAMLAAQWQLEAILAQAAAITDRDSSQDSARAYPRALAVRHTIERTCMEVIDRFGRICGPRALAGDAAMAKRVAELLLYVRQCHGERDLEELGSHAGWWSPP